MLTVTFPVRAAFLFSDAENAFVMMSSLLGDRVAKRAPAPVFRRRNITLE